MQPFQLSTVAQDVVCMYMWACWCTHVRGCMCVNGGMHVCEWEYACVCMTAKRVE